MSILIIAIIPSSINFSQTWVKMVMKYKLVDNQNLKLYTEDMKQKKCCQVTSVFTLV